MSQDFVEATPTATIDTFVSGAPTLSDRPQESGLYLPFDEKKVVVVEGDEEKASPDDAGPPPDGGLAAWLVIMGCACGGFCTFGFANAFGVFQSYYQDRIPGATQSTIAWIGSLEYCLIFLPGLLSGHMADKGWFKLPLLCGSIGLVTATFLVAECKTLWQLVLCQGFLLGGSAGFTFLPSLAVVPTWFDKKRGKAYGVVAVGSSIGGTILPIILRKLLAGVGFKWTVRILGFILLVLMIIFNLTVRPRVKLVKKDIVHIPITELFKNKGLMLYCLGLALIWLGLYNPLAFFDVSTQRIGVPSTHSFYAIVTANAASGFGRVTSGFWADVFGSMNVLILFSTIAAIMAICWPYAQTFPAVLVVAAIYGMASGAFISLMPSAISYMVPKQQMGRAMGLSSTMMAFGALVGNPIAGQILIASGGFEAVGGYSGATVLMSVGVLIAARRIALGRWIGKY